MAEERSAAGGRTPGPGPHGGGGSSPAAASRIRVDISDVTKLRQGIKDTQTEAKKLSDTLAKFDSTALPALRKVSDEMRQMQAALATSGTRSAVGPRSATSSGTGTGTANQHAGSFSGQATVAAGTGGGSYSRMGGLPSVNLGGSMIAAQPGRVSRFGSYLTTARPPAGTDMSRYTPQFAHTPLATGLAAALGAVTSVGNMAAGHLDDATTRSYLVNTLQLRAGASTGFGAQMNLNRNLGNMMGPNLGYGDVSRGVGTLMATGVTSGPIGATRMASVGFMSQINPLQGAAGSAQQVASIYNPQNYYRMRLAGVQMNSRNQNVKQLMDQIINRFTSSMGRKLSPEEIQSAADPGTHLGASVRAMGLSDDVIVNQLIPYWSARAATGKSGQAAINASGARNNLGANYAQRVGTAKGNALSKVDVGFIPGASGAAKAVAAEYNALGAAADNPVGRQLAAAAGGLAVFSGQLDHASKALKTMVEWMVAERVLGVGGHGGGGIGLGGLRGATGIGGGATRAAESGLERIGLRGLAGRIGERGLLNLGGRALMRGGMLGTAGMVAGAGIDWLGRKTHHRSTGHILGDAARGAGAGAMIGSVVPVVGTGVGALVGAGVGAAWGGRAGIEHGLSDLNPFGDSGQNANLWGGAGTTFPILEQMAAKGPHEIVTSTISGTHASNSYHYKGQAIDLADKRGSHDSPGLLAINHYLAKNYGHKLAELIYAGPGGINIKNGKVVNGMSLYGASTMAEHHNHVHVAATPGSLGMKGGVDVGSGGNPAGGGPQNAASSGGFSTPGSGAGGGIDNIFQDSSSAALFAALSGASGGGTGPVGMPRSAGLGGGGGGLAGGAAGAAGGLGGPPGKMPTGNLAQWERQALALLKLPYGRYARGLTNLIMHESGGNPHSINNWDSNAKAGHPSKGIMQTIDSTFMAHALPGHKDIWNPVDNIIAGVRYAQGRYGLGMIAGGGRHDVKGNYIGYARGIADVLRDEMAMLHKGEMVVQAPEAKQLRSLLANANAGSGRSSGGHRRPVPVQLVFTLQNGGEAEARKAAHAFAKYVAEDHDIDLVAAD